MRIAIVLLIVLTGTALKAEDLGAMWGTAAEEDKYYKLVHIPIPDEVPLKAGSFDILPDGRLAVGTRKGDVYFIDGAFEEFPRRSTTCSPAGKMRFSASRKKTAISTSRNSAK